MSATDRPSVLFDLDGTIGDTLPLCVAAFREAIEPLAGRQFTDQEIMATFGPSEEGTIAALLPHDQTQGMERYLERYVSLHTRCPSPFDGIGESLEYLKARGVFVGLITGKGPRSTPLTLAAFGLGDVFDVIKTGASTGPVKDVRIEEVIAEFSLRRESVLYVGDSPGDVAACRDCRIRIAAAAWAPTAEREALAAMQPDFLFTSVSQFREFVERNY